MTDKVQADGSRCECGLCLARAQNPAVRAWRGITALDLTKPPAPVIRWVLLLILGLCCWTAGIPLNIQDWLGPIIIGGALILPDVAGFGIAGVRLDLKQAQNEIAALKLRADMRQIQTGDLHFHGEEPAARVLGRSFLAELGEKAARNDQVVIVDDEAAEDIAS